MTAAIPRTKAQELISQLSELCESMSPIDELASLRFKREIERSKGVDAVNAYIARALLAMLEWDLPTLRSNFESALRLDHSSDRLDQYATCLQMMGDYGNAADNIESAYELARTNLDLLRKAINFSMLAARFNRAKELCDMYDKLCPSDSHPEREAIELALGVLSYGGFTEELAAQCNQIAFELLRERHVVFHQTASEGDMFDDGIMIVNILVDADQAMVDKLDIELGERLFDRVEGYDPNCYWVGYEQSERGKLQEQNAAVLA